MRRDTRFTFVCNKHERRAIAMLAAHHRRSQSDTVRLLIRQAAAQVAIKDACHEGEEDDHE